MEATLLQSLVLLIILPSALGYNGLGGLAGGLSGLLDGLNPLSSKKGQPQQNYPQGGGGVTQQYPGAPPPAPGGINIQPPNILLGGGGSGNECALACPYGWNTWGGLTEHCYLMPSQPIHLDTFWNQVEHCKTQENTSYPIIINDIFEQLLGSVVALQYAANYAEQLTNAFEWLGAYVNPNGTYTFLDGSDQNDNILMALNKIVGVYENGTCLGADPKTVGIWSSRPCNDTTGAVICEMAKRNVCGPTGGILPISPIVLNPCTIEDLIPHMISLPWIGQFLTSGSFLGLLGSGNGLGCRRGAGGNGGGGLGGGLGDLGGGLGGLGGLGGGGNGNGGGPLGGHGGLGGPSGGGNGNGSGGLPGFEDGEGDLPDLGDGGGLDGVGGLPGGNGCLPGCGGGELKDGNATYVPKDHRICRGCRKCIYAYYRLLRYPGCKKFIKMMIYAGLL